MRTTAFGSIAALVFATTLVAEQDAPPKSAAAPPAPASATAPATAIGVADITDLAESVRADAKLPAVGVAIVGLQGVEAMGFAGRRSSDGDDTIESTDRFHLGSCTKAMTATLAALFVREGSLRWDSTVAEVLGPSFPSMDASWRDVTLEGLLRHTGGAPTNPPAVAWKAAWDCGESSRACRKAFIEAVMAQPTTQPRGTFAYSNQGYAIAGAMIEHIANDEFEAIIQKRLFTPLGITSAGFGPPPEASGTKPDGTASNIDNPSAITPAGRAHMTLEDWGKFVALHLRRDGGDALPLKPADFERLHSLVPPPDEPREGPALGWRVLERGWGGGSVLTHAGSNTVWYCVAWLAPERGFALLAATNQGGPAATKACDEAVGALLAYRAALKVIQQRRTKDGGEGEPAKTGTRQGDDRGTRKASESGAPDGAPGSPSRQ